jgi:asparaginyl-tRNA synthetase
MADDSASLPGQLAATTLNDAVSSSEVPKAEFSDRVPIRSIVSRPDGGAGLAGNRVRIGGWVKTGRKADKDAFAFLELNDGSCPGNLQVIVDAAVADLSPLVPTGTCVVVDGVLKLPPSGTKQKVELRGEKVVHVGPVDPAKYPLPKTKLTLEFLRDVVHLRPRTNTVSSGANAHVCLICLF